MPRLHLSLVKFLDIQLDHNLFFDLFNLTLNDLVRFYCENTRRDLRIFLLDPLPNIGF